MSDSIVAPARVEAALRAMRAETQPWAGILAQEMAAHAITGQRRAAAFLANTCHETGGFRRLVENLNYGADRLVEVFGAHRISLVQAAQLGRIDVRNLHLLPGQTPHPANQRAIAIQVYGGAWGLKHLGNVPGTEDGWTFRGRGVLQLTGRSNYERFAATIGIDVMALLPLLEQPASAVRSAAHFWQVAGCNAIADTGDIAAVRRRVNGGAIGLTDVRRLYAEALAAFD